MCPHDSWLPLPAGYRAVLPRVPGCLMVLPTGHMIDVTFSNPHIEDHEHDTRKFRIRFDVDAPP